MKLSQHEQQILDEIEQGVQAEDPEFFASMTGSQSRRGGVGPGFGDLPVRPGRVHGRCGPGAGGAGVGCRRQPGRLPGHVLGVWLLCPGDRAFPQHGQESAPRQRLGRLWDSMKDPPPPGMSP